MALELAWVDVHAALRASVGDVHDGRLPGHQLGKRAYLVEVHLGVEADPALVGTARPVVLHAVAGEDVHLAVAEAHRHLDLDLAVGGPQHGGNVVGQLESLGGDSEPVLDDLVVRDLRTAGGRGVLGLLRGLVGLTVARTGVRTGLTLLRNGRPVGRLVLALRLPLLRGFVAHGRSDCPYPESATAETRENGPTISNARGHSSVGRAPVCIREAAGSSPAGSTQISR